MKPFHKLKITNPTGDAVLTKIELDGETQYISQFDIGFSMNTQTGRTDGLAVQLTYPFMAVEIEVEQVAVQRRFSARLFIPGYEGVTANGYGETIADALRDMASRLDAGQ